jgi:predicted nucleic acid-binding protein
VIAYLDSSVLLRIVLGQPDRLKDLALIESAVASDLAELECLRTLDRMRLRGALSVEELAQHREAVYRMTEETTLVEPTRAVLQRAAQPLPTPLGTLDAIHLSTAMSWHETDRSSGRGHSGDRRMKRAV